MTRDETIYANPEVFRPERFLDKDCTDPRGIVFGFGRRMCPGIQFADAAIFSGIASILSTFRISKSRDADGREITPSIEYTSDLYAIQKIKVFKPLIGSSFCLQV